ncbi:MAG TPA: phage major capsid protein [Candidatus Saccharimonadales bacterium]|nr:phage major capsid protein [Candidatus Saccharimonadales bacterium]
MNDRERTIRAKRLQVATDARGILNAGPADGALPAEDQARYDALMNEYDQLGTTLEALDRSAKAEADLSRSLTDPTRPTVGDIEATGKSGKRAKRATATPEYGKAFRRYLTTGMAPQGLMAASDLESRDLQMDADTAGGFIVAPEEFSDQIIKFVDNLVVIRRLGTKYRVPNAFSLGVPQLTADPDDADWTTELAVGNDDAAMTFGKREFRPTPLAKQIKVSNKLIRAAANLTQFTEDGETESPMNVDGLVMDRLGYKFGVAEEKGFLTGTGVRQPLGVFTASADGIDTSRDTTCASTTAIAADDLISTKYSLKAQYWTSKSLAWMFHRTAIAAVRKLKDTNGQYLWAPSGIGQANLSGDQADTILDVPFFASEYVPSTFTAGLYVGLLGDWRFYWIVDALDFTVQRLVELYAGSNQIGFIGRKEVDGMPVLAEAFARVILHS